MITAVGRKQRPLEYPRLEDIEWARSAPADPQHRGLEFDLYDNSMTVSLTV